MKYSSLAKDFRHEPSTTCSTLPNYLKFRLGGAGPGHDFLRINWPIYGELHASMFDILEVAHALGFFFILAWLFEWL